MSSSLSRSALRPFAILLSLLLALAGLSFTATPARAAAGDVAGATLQWGVKASFRSYLTGPIAHGHWTASGVSDATPFGWSGGSGAAPGGTGTVGYPGTLQFQGHQGVGVSAEEYALDLTFSDVRVRLTGATSGELVLDARSRGLADPTTFAELNDVVFATLDLSGATDASTDSVIAWSNVAVTLTADGATAFGGFYSAGQALDTLAFSWPVEAASDPDPDPEPEPEPAVPTITVSDTTDLESGDVVTVSGENFGLTEGAPLGTRPPLAGKYAGVYVTFGTFLDTWKPSEAAPSAARKTAPGVTKWVVDADDLATIGGTAAGGVAIEDDGSFEVQITVTEDFTGALADGNYGIYTYPGSGAVYAPFETYTPITFAVPVPTITVSPTTGLQTGDVVTVTGENFGPDDTGAPLGTRPPLAGKFAGVYVTFGTFLDTWKPSESAPSSARKTAPGVTKWVVDAADLETIGGTAAGGVAIEDDGSFEVQITVTEDFVGSLDDGNYGIYTYPGSGAVYAPFETYTPIEFTVPVPTITVSDTTDLESGDVVTVSGENFGPTRAEEPLGTRPPLAGKFAGVYVTFGTFLDTWKPSESAPSSARKTAPGVTKWVVDAADLETIGGTAAGGVAIEDDGSFEVEITVTEDFADALEDGNYGIYTYPGSGAVYAPFETYTPITFAEPAPPTPNAGSLSWGVKASFRDYVVGPIANGSISVGNGAGIVGGVYWFPQSGGSVDDGQASYRGSVAFSGHGGLLDLRLSDPVVRLTSSSSGVLSLQTSTGRVNFATLDLGAGTVRTDSTGARTYAGVPATLTAAGAASFEGFYSAGTALDPVTFTIGSVNTRSGTASTVAAPAAETNTPADTPPATDGIETTTTSFAPGSTYTFTAGGFEPRETGILVVIYSDPTVLATDATADAAGVVTWTGVLPAGLTGEHTLTFQGSVDRGVVLEIAEPAAVGCPVAGAELVWGFKESFRAYIDGSIANGEWTTADGATYETPVFTWATGTGGYDAETGDADLAFTGSVRFTGHDGLLDTTIANPRVVIVGERAVLLVDVSGTTQEGDEVSSIGVEFVELDLAAAQPGGGGDLVAFTGIPTTLTEAGAAAFGTYEAGTAFDPIDLSITLDPACVSPVAEVDEEPVETEAATSVSPLPWIIGALVLLIVVAVVAVLLMRRARRA